LNEISIFWNKIHFKKEVRFFSFAGVNLILKDGIFTSKKERERERERERKRERKE